MKKAAKKRKGKCQDADSAAAACVLNSDPYVGDPYAVSPDLDSELNAILKKNKLLPSDDAQQILIAHGPPKPYTRQKDEVLNDFLTCLSLVPKDKWTNML